MFEKHICPVCWAFKDPRTNRCLVCDKSYIILMDEPVALQGDNPIKDYCMPVISNGKVGFLTFRGHPFLTSTVDNFTNSFSFTIDILPDMNDNSVYRLTLAD